MSLVLVDGVACRAAVLTVPLVGCWTLDVSLASGLGDGSPVECEFGDIRLSGTSFRGGDFVGSGAARIVGGRGGWRSGIPAKSYQSSFGVKAASLVKDAAREAGETVTEDVQGTVGPHWVRPARPAVWTMTVLCPSWWMGFDGVTVPSARPPGAMSASVRLNVVPRGTSLSAGRVAMSPDLLAGVLPGLTFSAPSVPVPQTALSVVHRLDGDRVRTEVWTR